jgi:catalase
VLGLKACVTTARLGPGYLKTPIPSPNTHFSASSYRGKTTTKTDERGNGKIKVPSWASWPSSTQETEAGRSMSLKPAWSSYFQDSQIQKDSFSKERTLWNKMTSAANWCHSVCPLHCWLFLLAVVCQNCYCACKGEWELEPWHP